MKKKIYWTVEFEGDRYCLVSDMIGREQLLKNDEIIGSRVNLRTRGSYKITTADSGVCELRFSLNTSDMTHRIQFMQDSTILAEYTQSLDHLLPDWLQQDKTAKEPKTSGKTDKRQWIKKTGNAIFWLLISFIVWGLIFSWVTAPVLILVLLFHEAGHYAVMRIAGYRNRKLQMLPPFGAVVYGEKPESPDWERFCLYIAGPLPGIILAFLLLNAYGWSAVNGFLHEVIIMLFAINYFNLLPIQPLDGGKIVEIMFLHKAPVLQIIISSIGALALLILSIIYKDVILGLLVVIIVGLLVSRVRALGKPDSLAQTGIETEELTGRTTRWYERAVAALLYIGIWIPAILALI